VIAFARTLTAPAVSRLARVTAAFTFVAHLADTPPAPAHEPRDGVDLLLRRARRGEGPAVILCALLQAIGERAHVAWAAGVPVARVELDAADVAGLPPYAGLFTAHGRYFIPLDPRDARRPVGFIPGPLREALVRHARRRLAGPERIGFVAPLPARRA
jgi:hypothetical protein